MTTTVFRKFTKYPYLHALLYLHACTFSYSAPLNFGKKVMMYSW